MYKQFCLAKCLIFKTVFAINGYKQTLCQLLNTDLLKNVSGTCQTSCTQDYINKDLRSVQINNNNSFIYPLFLLIIKLHSSIFKVSFEIFLGQQPVKMAAAWLCACQKLL